MRAIQGSNASSSSGSRTGSPAERSWSSSSSTEPPRSCSWRFSRAPDSSVEPKIAAAMLFFAGGAVAALFSSFLAYVNRAVRIEAPERGRCSACSGRRHPLGDRQRGGVPHRHEHGWRRGIGEVELTSQGCEREAARAQTPDNAPLQAGNAEATRAPLENEAFAESNEAIWPRFGCGLGRTRHLAGEFIPFLLGVRGEHRELLLDHVPVHHGVRIGCISR